MAQVSISNTYTGSADASSSTVSSVTVASGEGLLIGVLLEVTDAGKEVTSVVWDSAGVNESLTEFADFSPTHGKQRLHVYAKANPTAKTATVTVTLAASQKHGVVVCAVANHNTTTMLSGSATAQGTGSTGSVSVTQDADDLAFCFAGHFASAGNFAPGGGETELADFAAAGAFKVWAAYEDGSGATTLSWSAGGGSKEYSTVGFVIETGVTVAPANLGAGSYTHTGNSITALKASVAALGAGSFALSGHNLTAVRSVSATLDAGSYTFTGQNLTALRALVANLDAGSYGLTGHDLTGTRALIANLGAGSYTHTGYDIIAAQQVQAQLAAGSYTHAGYDITGTRVLVATLDAGSYTLTGHNLTATIGEFANLDAGSYALTGYDLTALQTYAATLDAGSYTHTGHDLTAVKSIIATFDAGSYTLTGGNLTALRTLVANLDAGVYTVTGYDLTATESAAANVAGRPRYTRSTVKRIDRMVRDALQTNTKRRLTVAQLREKATQAVLAAAVEDGVAITAAAVQALVDVHLEPYEAQQSATSALRKKPKPARLPKSDGTLEPDYPVSPAYLRFLAEMFPAPEAGPVIDLADEDDIAALLALAA